MAGLALLDKRKNSRLDAQSTSTKIIAEFFSFPGKGFSGKSNSKLGFFKLGYITGFSSSKQMGEPAGTFTLTLKKPKEMTTRQYSDLWSDPEGNWVLIQAVIDGEPHDVMLGVIDAVTDGVERSELGTRSETYQIHGRDFGKIFAETVCLFDAMLGKSLDQYSEVANIIGARSINATPAQLLKLILKVWLFNKASSFAFNLPWELPPGMGGLAFANLLSTSGIQAMTRDKHGSVSDMTLLNPDGQIPLWDLMQSVSNGVMNELFVDLKWDGKKTGLVPTVTLRERMFPTSTSYGVWEGISTFTVQRRDVQRRQLAKGGAGNRYNFWSVTPVGAQGAALYNQIAKSGAVTGLPGSVPIINRLSLKRYGLRKNTNETPFIPYGADDIDWAQLGVDWTKKIFDWYSVSPLQVSGTIGLTRIFPEIRIGMRLIESRTDGDMSYYVEGVEHSWGYPGTGSTSVTVTRGQPKDVDLLKKVYAELLVPVSAAANFNPLDVINAEMTDGTVF